MTTYIRPRCAGLTLTATAALLLLWVAGLSAEPLAKADTPKAQDQYHGRRIAQTMHFAGAPWLIRESREREEECTAMLAQLGAEPGMTVCDMGCGNGFYTLPLARQVGPKGKVLAVDIQREMLQLLSSFDPSGISVGGSPVLSYCI